MAGNIEFTATPTGRLRRGFAIALLATAAIYGLVSTPAEARMLREIMPPMPTAPRQPMPAIHHPPQIPMNLRPVISSIQRNLGTTALRSRGGGRGGPRIGSAGGSSTVTVIEPDLDTLKKQKAALDAKKKAAAKKLADLENSFLNSADGKDAKKKVDEEKKKRDAKKKKALEDHFKRLGNMDPNCCGLEEQGDSAGKLVDDQGKADDEYDEAKKKIIEDEMKKSDPEKAKEYKQAQDDSEKAKKASAKAQQKLDKAQQKEWDKADMDFGDD